MLSCNKLHSISYEKIHHNFTRRNIGWTLASNEYTKEQTVNIEWG